MATQPPKPTLDLPMPVADVVHGDQRQQSGAVENCVHGITNPDAERTVLRTLDVEEGASQHLRETQAPGSIPTERHNEKDPLQGFAQVATVLGAPLARRSPGGQENVLENATSTMIEESGIVQYLGPCNPQDEEGAHLRHTVAEDRCLEPCELQQPIAAIAETMDRSVQATQVDTLDELVNLRDEAANLEKQLCSQETERRVLIDRIQDLETSLAEMQGNVGETDLGRPCEDSAKQEQDARIAELQQELVQQSLLVAQQERELASRDAELLLLKGSVVQQLGQPPVVKPACCAMM